MEYVLKVSPKGQVILPKKIRERLRIKELLSISIGENEVILKRPDLNAEKLAGCFKDYARNLTIEDAIEKAIEVTASETAQKNN